MLALVVLCNSDRWCEGLLDGVEGCDGVLDLVCLCDSADFVRECLMVWRVVTGVLGLVGLLGIDDLLDSGGCVMFCEFVDFGGFLGVWWICCTEELIYFK